MLAAAYVPSPVPRNLDQATLRELARRMEARVKDLENYPIIITFSARRPFALGIFLHDDLFPVNRHLVDFSRGVDHTDLRRGEYFLSALSVSFEKTSYSSARLLDPVIDMTLFEGLPLDPVRVAAIEATAAANVVDIQTRLGLFNGFNLKWFVELESG